jgi:dTDP-4-dehydrorhamnose reductase
MVFDGTSSPRNLISKLVHYERVIDVSNSLTFIPDLLVATDALIASRATGLFHVVNPGAISPFEIVQRYKEICDPEHSCSRLPEAELSDVVRAPRSNCILCADKLQSYGVQMPDVREAVDRALHSIKQAKILPG